MSENVLQVSAVIDVMDHNKTEWKAEAPSIGIFGGIYAIGATFAEARHRFAETVAMAITAGAVTIDGLDPNNVSAIRVIALTRKTFSLEALHDTTVPNA